MPRPSKPIDRERSVGYLLRYAHRAFVKALARELAPYRISTGQWTILRALWKEDGISQVMLAERIGVEKASLTGVLASLARRRLILRQPNRNDRRRIDIFLTPSSRKLERQLLSCGQTVNDRATARLPAADIEAFARIIRHLLDNLEARPAATARVAASRKQAAKAVKRSIYRPGSSGTRRRSRRAKAG